LLLCQDDLLTVDNAQSHVTAFRPISEAARSWSDDNTKLTQMQLHFTHSNQWQQMKWSQRQHTASSAMPIFRWDLTISNFLFSISVCSLSGKLYTSSVILKACHRQNDIETRHRQSPSHSVTLQALELTLSTFKCQLKCQVCQLRNHLFQH